MALLLEDSLGLSFLLNLFTSRMLLVGIFVVTQKRRLITVAALLALALLTLIWGNQVGKNTSLELVTNLLGASFIGLLIGAIRYYLFSVTSVNQKVISASIVGYSLIGLFWMFAFGFLEVLSPGSCSLP